MGFGGKVVVRVDRSRDRRLFASESATSRPARDSESLATASVTASSSPRPRLSPRSKTLAGRCNSFRSFADLESTH
jgi:hypothetical protein